MCFGSIESMSYYRAVCDRCGSYSVVGQTMCTPCLRKCKQGYYCYSSRQQMYVRRQEKKMEEDNDLRTDTEVRVGRQYIPTGDKEIYFIRVVRYDYNFSYEVKNYGRWKAKIMRRAARRTVVSEKEGVVTYTYKIKPKVVEVSVKEETAHVQPHDEALDYTAHDSYSSIGSCVHS